jgi:hypothetical protein
MKHITKEDATIQALLRSTRSIAVVGASPNADRHSHDVVAYLHRAGYDVVPVRPDRTPIAGVATYATLQDVAGSIDLVAIFRRPDAVVPHIREAVAKRAYAVWLPPGAWSQEAEEEARRHDLTLVKERCIIEEHKHLASPTGDQTAGHAKKLGVHVPRRRRAAKA